MKVVEDTHMQLKVLKKSVEEGHKFTSYSFVFEYKTQNLIHNSVNEISTVYSEFFNCKMYIYTISIINTTLEHIF